MRYFALAAAAAALAAPAQAQPTDPAAQRVESYFAQVQTVMKAALPMKSRVDRFEPIVTATYDNAAALALAAGPAYRTASPADRAAATAALARRGAVLHAGNFARFDGERFIVEPQAQTRGADKLVRARIQGKSGAPATLIYRLRQGADGQWRILDVVSEGVSQLAVQRSDFAAALKIGGLPALTRRLTELNAKALAAAR